MVRIDTQLQVTRAMICATICLATGSTVACTTVKPTANLDPPVTTRPTHATTATTPSPSFFGEHRATFDVTVESSCSRSYDVTTYTGDMTLAVAKDERTASFEMKITSRSNGPGYDSWRFQGGKDLRHCRWKGEATRDGDALLIALVREGPNDVPYECEGTNYGTREPLREFAMRCERPTSGAERLVCTTPGASPYVAMLAREHGAIPLGSQQAVDISVYESDAIQGVLVKP